MTNEERWGMNKPEPAPSINDSIPIWELVVSDMVERDKAGRQKYGTPLQAGNGRNPLVDAYQEAMDLTVYLRQEIAEREAQAATIARLERELAEAKPKSEALDALGDLSSRRPITLELWQRQDGCGCDLYVRNGEAHGMGQTTAAAIMDAVRKAEA